MLRSYTEMFRSMENDDETAIKIEELKKTIALAGQKKNKLLELVTFGTVTAANFKSMTDSCDREIDEANAEIAELEKLVFTKDEYRRHMSEVRTRGSCRGNAAASLLFAGMVSLCIVLNAEYSGFHKFLSINS